MWLCMAMMVNSVNPSLGRAYTRELIVELFSTENKPSISMIPTEIAQIILKIFHMFGKNVMSIWFLLNMNIFVVFKVISVYY